MTSLSIRILLPIFIEKLLGAKSDLWELFFFLFSFLLLTSTWGMHAHFMPLDTVVSGCGNWSAAVVKWAEWDLAWGHSKLREQSRTKGNAEKWIRKWSYHVRRHHVFETCHYVIHFLLFNWIEIMFTTCTERHFNLYKIYKFCIYIYVYIYIGI